MRREWFVGVLLGCAPVGEPEPAPTPATASIVAEPDTPPAEPPSEVAPEPEPKAPSEPAFQAVTRGAGNCMVTITALLEAQQYRGGGPMTPALDAQLSANPDFARSYNAHSHGDHHIQCHYEVTLAHLPGQRFRWRAVHNNLLRDLTLDVCKQKLDEVADDIIETTKQCTDFAAGAWWGYVLEPLP